MLNWLVIPERGDYVHEQFPFYAEIQNLNIASYFSC